MAWKKFNALGTEIIITASLNASQKNLLEQAEKIVLDFEKRFSRFINGNELGKFNDFSGGEYAASVELINLLKEAKRLYLLTGGVFDPTVIGSLEKVGYDRSFGETVSDARAEVDLEKIKTEFLSRPKMDDLEILTDKIIKPKGFRLDFGGLGKGYIADYLGDNLFAQADDFWISAGGDLLVKGRESETDGLPAQAGWKIGVQNPYEPDREVFHIKNRGEKIGVATSGVFKRKGTRGGINWHHLIDPKSGFPVENDILAVSAIASGAAEADVFAKTVLLLGQSQGLKFIDCQPDSACLIFLKDGDVVFSQKALYYF